MGDAEIPVPQLSQSENVNMTADADIRVVQSGQPTAEQSIRMNALHAAMQIRAQRNTGHWALPPVLEEADLIAAWISTGSDALANAQGSADDQ